MSRSQKTVFIYTMADDWHALLAEAALKERGHRVIRYFGSDFPERADLALEYGRDLERYRLHTVDGEVDLSTVDVVWNRRMEFSVMPRAIDPRDRDYVAKQLRFADVSLRTMLRHAFWINPFEHARAADAKPFQLQMARRNGLLVPETLISNRPEAIRAFLETHDDVIHKPLIGAAWEENDKVLTTYTARVKLEDLPRDELLRAAPGIFQAKVPKQFEVRAQFFGESCFAMKIDPSRIEYGDLDWRRHQHGSMTDGSVQLPDAVREACLRQLRSLGLVAGAFDFIVSPDGEWFYLEVNEAGQFIFVEQWCEELPVFDALCDFIESSDPAFRYVPKANPQTLAGLLERANPEDTAKNDAERRKAVVPLPAPEQAA